MPDPFNKEREQIHRQMMSSVSHDLRTPLAAIIGSLEIHEQMNAQLSPEKKKALLSMALQEAHRLDNFITNILDMAKLESGQTRAKKEVTDINELVQSAVNHLGAHVKKSGIKITADTGRLTCNTDPVLLRRALGLLVDNANKHGSHDIEIHFGRGEFAQNYISIRDFGAGVPEANRKAIFSKYTRFVKQDTQNAGTGLGLSICTEIMKMLEGEVAVENHKDGGAVFTLRFPAG